MYDEMKCNGHLNSLYAPVAKWIEETGIERLHGKQQEAEALFRKIGITFAVYGENAGAERLIPFDIIPRIFSDKEWTLISKGVEQRALALNAFLRDIYGKAHILKDGIVPKDKIYNNAGFEKIMQDITPPCGVYSHIVGIDLVRLGPDEFYVLEDNCRTPSGVSYVLENREIMVRMFPELFIDGNVEPVDDYPRLLRQILEEVKPAKCEGQPMLAVLTPGPLNSAYYEHSFLADEMGAELVEGADLYVEDDLVWMRTTRGPQRVDVIYRRIDDAFLDPDCFRPESVLGVAGLMNAYQAGGVTIVNAPGAGIADDKAIYTYVPDMIRYYLDQDPILQNVQTYRCGDPDDLKYVVENIGKLVVKEVHGSGGYGMLIGPKSTKQEQQDYLARVQKDPGGFIAQPTLALSTSPILVDEGLAPRHVDFRPFALVGKEVKLVPGGLTRVALREGSLVVNSSQGGGVKDTWVLSAS